MPKKQSKETRGHDIVTYYFTDSTRNFVVKTIWSKWSRSAAQRAFDRLSMGDLDALVAVVYDDYYGQDHAILVKDPLTGRVTMDPLREFTNPLYAGTSKNPFGEFVKKKRPPKARLVDPILADKLKIKILKKNLHGKST